MSKLRNVLKSACIPVLALVLAPLASAQATRTWVSGVGDDVNPCSRTAPCKTFAGAISKTAAGGEISTLDPGSFGTITITKAITINGDGNLAGILSSGLTAAITVNAAATDRVVIRNISINGAGTGLNGVRFLAGRELVLENVTIQGVTTRGVDVALTTANSTLSMKDVSITNANTGVRITTSSLGGNVVGLFEGVRMNTLSTGLEVAANAAVFARNCEFSRSNTGVTTTAAGAVASIESSVISFNGTGVNATAGSTINLADNAIYSNSNGVTFAGVVNSAGNNRVQSNGATTPIVNAINLD